MKTKTKLIKNLKLETIEKLKNLTALENKTQAEILENALNEYYKNNIKRLKTEFLKVV